MKRIFAFIAAALIIALMLCGCAITARDYPPDVGVTPWAYVDPNATLNPAMSPPGY